MIIDHFYFIKLELLTCVSISRPKPSARPQFISRRAYMKTIRACKLCDKPKKAERWINLLHVEDLHWIPLLLSYSTGRWGAAEQKRRAPSKRWGWRRRVEERGMQPWSEKLRGRQRGGREEEIQGRRGFNTSVEGVCVSIRGGHTVRFESVRSKKKRFHWLRKV